MMTRLVPEVGCWYRQRSGGSLFQVVALDEQVGTIETQDCDGDLDELDFGEWYDLGVELVAAPEDPIGPADPLEPEEREYALSGEGWDPPMHRDVEDLAESFDQRDESLEDYLSDLDEPLH
jgi:hypothetical protein